MEKLTDNSPMPYGVAHKGKELINVPASYLLWCYNEKQKTIPANLKEYIKDNLDVLNNEVRNNNPKKREY